MYVQLKLLLIKIIHFFYYLKILQFRTAENKLIGTATRNKR